MFSLIQQAFRVDLLPGAVSRSHQRQLLSTAVKALLPGLDFEIQHNPLSPGAEQQGITIGCRWTRTLGAFAGDLGLLILHFKT